MKNLFILLFFLTVYSFIGCTSNGSQSIPSSPAIIPEPASLEEAAGEFTLNRETVISIDSSSEEVINVSTQLKKTIDSATGFDLMVTGDRKNAPDQNVISLLIEPNSDAYTNDEAYHLSVSEDSIALKSATANGLFYGMQTLLQLFPVHIYQEDYTLVPQNIDWIAPSVTIKDYPRFDYRGMHLDVARHLFPVEFIKKYLDLMAMHKMNTFHWHLTEDQGWRIEIEQYPKLTEVGAWRDSTLVGYHGSDIYDGERYGGYYSQEEIREVVSYAKERHITVIPEIEMPGHASAALASYPELGCIEGKDYRVKTTWGIFDDLYCPSEQTFTFLENVLTEVMDLFPSEYIHIGGDEAPKKQWEESDLAQQVMEREGLEDEHELQSYFITRIEKFLNSHGRQIIGWDEILEGGLAPNATVMSWRGVDGGIEAARQHHDVVMTPTTHLYLDYYQADRQQEPLANNNGHTTLEETYAYEPIPEELSEQESEYILGAQGNVWTEYMHSGQKVEYMAYPRASALSEVNWSPQSHRDWDDFHRRMQIQFNRFDVLGVNAAEHYRESEPRLESAQEN